MSSPTSSILSLSDNFEIRALNSRDIKKVSDLHADTLPITYSHSFFRKLLFHPSRICLLAYPSSNPKTPVAFITASITIPSHDLRTDPKKSYQSDVQILTLGVLPEYRRNGIARQLVRAAVQSLQGSTRLKESLIPEGATLTAYISVENMDGRNFYESGLGMRIGDEIFRNWYRTSCLPPSARDAVVVVGNLTY